MANEKKDIGKAGIVIGIVAAIVLVVLIGWFTFRPKPSMSEAELKTHPFPDPTKVQVGGRADTK